MPPSAASASVVRWSFTSVPPTVALAGRRQTCPPPQRSQTGFGQPGSKVPPPRSWRPCPHRQRAVQADIMDDRRADGAAGLVMVGVDLSSGSAAATDLAAYQAKRRHVPLLLVHGYLDGMPYSTIGGDLHQPLAVAARHEARSRLTDLEIRTRADHPGLTVRSTLVAGGGASTLVELSRTASLVVVGARGSGGFAGLALGSVGAQVARHAHAPVIVARPTDVAEPAAAPVLVGVDGSGHSQAALGFALDEAAARAV